MIDSLVHLMLRMAFASVLLLLAGTLIYGFGAGYFWPIGLPTPLNVVATGVLTAAVLRWAWRYVTAGWAKMPVRSSSQ